MKFDIVIAGGGFAAAYCARTLGKMLGHEEGRRRVALISERNVFTFQPMLAEVVGAALSPQDVVNPLRLFCRGVTVLQGRIHEIDWTQKQLVLDGGRFTRDHVIEFDHLVLALGSVTDLSKVPGLAEYGWPMKTVSDALRLRSTIINRLEEANLVEDPVVQARLLTFVVVGGGYTGVETAGQIHALVTESCRLYSNLKDAIPRVILVHSQGQLLMEIGPELGAYAQKVLEQDNVEVRLNTRVMEVTATKAILNDGTTIDAATLVSTIGSAPNPVVLDVCRQLSVNAPKGRIEVEPTMRVGGQTHLWAIGDCAAVPWDDQGTLKVSPPTSQFALRHGQQLGQNLIRALYNQPLKPFKYRYLGQLATIGSHQAVAEIMGFHFRGFIAWWMWRTIYLSKLPGVLRKLRVMIDWTLELLFNRDISLVLPPAEDVLRAIHLEKDEVLIDRDDHVRAFFFIRRGSISLTDKEGTVHRLGAGSVIDQSYLGDEERWPIAATAAESSDVMVFRGRALDLLRKDLRLVPQAPGSGSPGA
ncbi:MAG TPA: FAD-dependent oxidoreductase [Opitutaceae bacterium]|nr:FAD-dependent oxidoreductase [Opitutaceae bacterium]